MTATLSATSGTNTSPQALPTTTTPPISRPTAAPPPAHQPRTPLHIQHWVRLLADHPDRTLSSYVIDGLRQGFSIGYSGARYFRRSPNLPSAHQQRAFVSRKLAEACAADEIAGPYAAPPFQHLRCSGLGTVPKKSGSLRLIHHLSAPAGHSINDGISREDFSLRYVTVDDAVQMILACGPGCHLTKVDIRSAFRLCPVRRADWELLGMHWDGAYYYDKRLPFGLRSSPYIFNCVADTLEWMLRHHGALQLLIHYLDDFLSVALTASQAAHHLTIFQLLFAYLGVPMADDKTASGTCVQFLGILLDTVAMEARLPGDKLTDLKTRLNAVYQRRTCSKRDLLSLIGSLSFACKVVVPGRTFLRRLIDLSTTVGPLHHHVTLTAAARADLRWWSVFLASWNGRSLFLDTGWTPSPQMELYTDASSTIGYGAYYNGQWFAGTWAADPCNEDIAYKELYAIVLAVNTWGHLWPRRRILFHCDNAAVVAVVRSGTSRSPPLMALLRCLFYICAHYHCSVSAVHIEGSSNAIADSLSRGQMDRFRQLAPCAASAPSVIRPLPTLS